jgi:putative ABC transport system permease protein
VIYWAWRQWLAQPGRTSLSVLVSAAVVALCVLFEGVRFGMFADLHDFPAALPADWVAIEKGNAYFAMAPSKLPQLSRSEAEAVPGVASAAPLALLPFILDAGDVTTPAILLAFDTAGGPARLASGRVPAADGEIAVDRSLAHRHGLAVGDTVRILDEPLTITGISLGGRSPFMPYVHIPYDALLSLLFATDLPVGIDDLSLVSALLVRAAPGVDPGALRAPLQRAVPDADLFTPQQLGDADAAFGRRLVGPVLSLVIAIAWIIAALAMGLLRYADVQAHLREHGVLKALGAGPGRLAVALAAEGLLVALPALPLALAIAYALAALIADWNALYVARLWEPGVLARAGAAAVTATLAGSLIPLRRLARLDPAIVFQR